jgi:hypothetical protein
MVDPLGQSVGHLQDRVVEPPLGAGQRLGKPSGSPS